MRIGYFQGLRARTSKLTVNLSPMGVDGVLTERRKFISRFDLTRRNDTNGDTESYLESEQTGNFYRVE